MSTTQVRISADPRNWPAMCRFTIEQPIYPNESFFFGNKDQSAGSPLAERLFAIEGVTTVLISHDQVTVTKGGFEEWPVVGRKIGAAIREHLASGRACGTAPLRESMAPRTSFVNAYKTFSIRTSIQPWLRMVESSSSSMLDRTISSFQWVAAAGMWASHADVAAGGRIGNPSRGARSRSDSRCDRPCRGPQSLLRRHITDPSRRFRERTVSASEA